MTEVLITPSQLAPVKDKVIVLTGGSSGIGLATTSLLLSLGARVVSGDLNPPTDPSILSNPNFIHQRTDVTSWTDLLTLFKAAVGKWGKVDAAYPNAGIGPKQDFLNDDLDPEGNPTQPHRSVAQINYLAVLDTVKIAVHWLKKNPDGGSIVLAASASSYQQFTVTEYTCAKHAILGLLRSLPHLPPKIRINAIAPSWTETSLFDSAAARKAGLRTQPASVVAECVALLIADASRNRQLLYSVEGHVSEIEVALLDAAEAVMRGVKCRTPRTRDEMGDMRALTAAMVEAARGGREEEE